MISPTMMVMLMWSTPNGQFPSLPFVCFVCVYAYVALQMRRVRRGAVHASVDPERVREGGLIRLMRTRSKR